MCTPGAEVTALALSNAHVAVGTACGSVMVWQCEAGSDECKQVGGCVGVGVGMVEWECMCGVGIVGCGVYTYN